MTISKVVALPVMIEKQQTPANEFDPFLDEYLTPEGGAKESKTSTATIYRNCKSGKLRHARVGGQFRRDPDSSSLALGMGREQHDAG
jgi:hypothetical protein